MHTNKKHALVHAARHHQPPSTVSKLPCLSIVTRIPYKGCTRLPPDQVEQDTTAVDSYVCSHRQWWSSRKTWSRQGRPPCNHMVAREPAPPTLAARLQTSPAASAGTRTRTTTTANSSHVWTIDGGSHSSSGAQRLLPDRSRPYKWPRPVRQHKARQVSTDHTSAPVAPDDKSPSTNGAKAWNRADLPPRRWPPTTYVVSSQRRDQNWWRLLPPISHMCEISTAVIVISTGTKNLAHPRKPALVC